jgi:thiosulfate/3-mercaptopyruvate sulfurtransferase
MVSPTVPHAVRASAHADELHGKSSMRVGRDQASAFMTSPQRVVRPSALHPARPTRMHTVQFGARTRKSEFFDSRARDFQTNESRMRRPVGDQGSHLLRSGMRTLPVLLGAALAAGFGTTSLGAQTRSAPMRVDAQWLTRRLADTSVVLVHVVSDPSEYEAGHVPGSVPMPVSSFAVLGADSLRAELPSASVLKDRLEAIGLADGRDIVVIGTPVPAARFAFTLATLGLEARTHILDGGIEEWRERAALTGAQRTTVSRAPSAPRPRGTLTITPRPGLVASIADVQAAIASTAANRPKVLDARAVEFYSGASAGAMPRAGHIPTAGNVPLTGLTAANGLLRPASDVRTLMRAAGAPASGSGSVITYCHIGMQASLLWLQARLAGYEARVFDGSWQAWSRDASLPIEGAPTKP